MFTKKNFSKILKHLYEMAYEVATEGREIQTMWEIVKDIETPHVEGIDSPKVTAELWDTFNVRFEELVECNDGLEFKDYLPFNNVMFYLGRVAGSLYPKRVGEAGEDGGITYKQIISKILSMERDLDMNGSLRDMYDILEGTQYLLDTSIKAVGIKYKDTYIEALHKLQEAADKNLRGGEAAYPIVMVYLKLGEVMGTL